VSEIKAKRVKKQKTDRKDAQLLLRLMREDNIGQVSNTRHTTRANEINAEPQFE